MAGVIKGALPATFLCVSQHSGSKVFDTHPVEVSETVLLTQSIHAHMLACCQKRLDFQGYSCLTAQHVVHEGFDL